MKSMRAAGCMLALGTLVAGCGSPLVERVQSDRWTRWPTGDPKCCAVSASLAQLAKHRFRDDQVWAPPFLVGARNNASQPTPSNALLRVRVTIFPKISCKGRESASRRKPPAEFDQSLAAANAAELKALGTPEQTEEIWIAAFDKPRMFKRDIGAAWLGQFARHAGDGELYFPPYQDCGAMVEAQPERLPRRVFGSEDDVYVSARSPFTVKVLEVCSQALVSQREEVLVTYQIPIVTWGYSVGMRETRQRYTDRVEARCASGVRSFEFGPVVTGFQLAKDPKPSLRVGS